jgi:hypothetical protein
MVSIAASRLTQAVFNLVQNAGEALAAAPGRAAQDKGVIKVSARALGGDGAPGSSGAGLPSGMIELLIEDDGPGMAPEVAARCFEPYFSTKVRTVSTGMGLAMVRAWVEGAGGAVRLRTAPGSGAHFSLILRPRSGLEVVESTSKTAAARGPAPHAAITVEDKRTLSFVSVMIETAQAKAERWEHDGVPNAELWVVGGAAATPERVAAFLAQDGSRRAVVLADSAPGYSPHSQGPSIFTDPRVSYVGKKPGTAELRRALVEALARYNKDLLTAEVVQ